MSFKNPSTCDAISDNSILFFISIASFMNTSYFLRLKTSINISFMISIKSRRSSLHNGSNNKISCCYVMKRRKRREQRIKKGQSDVLVKSCFSINFKSKTLSSAARQLADWKFSCFCLNGLSKRVAKTSFYSSLDFYFVPAPFAKHTEAVSCYVSA